MNNDYWTNKPQERQGRITYKDIPKLERQFKDGIAFVEDGIEFYLNDWELSGGHGYAYYVGQERTRQMTEHKFKVGDWVRATASDEVVSIGDIGKITEPKSPVPYVNWIGKKRWSYIEKDLEPWMPRVGERVRIVKDGLSTDGAVGKLATVERVIDHDSWPYLLLIDGPVDYKSYAVTPEYTRCGLDCIEPAVTPTATPSIAHASPIRTVTRKEVVPGVYGDVTVSGTNADGVSIWLPANSRYTATRLRAIIATLTEIADALDSNS